MKRKRKKFNLLTFNSGYSAHEHSALYGSIYSLSYDITFETLAAVFLVSIGLVLNSEKLRPISWSVWAGELEKEGGAKNPFRGYEDRFGFWDVRVGSGFFLNYSPIPQVFHFGLSCKHQRYTSLFHEVSLNDWNNTDETEGIRRLDTTGRGSQKVIRIDSKR